jgi:two-component system, NarL family, response regulator DevR
MFRRRAAAYSASMDAPRQLATAAQPSRVFLVEDSTIIRERLLQLLGGLHGVEVVGDADNAVDAIAGIVAAKPDVVVLDIKLKNGSGIDVLKRVKQSLPRLTVIMLTNYATSEYRRKCLEAGAEYFLDKTNEFENLRAILHRLRHDNQPGATPSC